MKCTYACGYAEHVIARRQFLGQLATGSLAAGGAGLFTSPLAAEALTEQHKRVLLFYMAGGLSQLESWDPKPATPTGGPFRAFPPRFQECMFPNCCRKRRESWTAYC